eukprot:TRINITY_DN11313_c0_g2_i1.p1 TRINITY_DN11313_c0_g2~~TRINITY_DN11313_c0_g2_i1.p1  ORF type:complete len:172 (-),score=25.74 TRINITY_DN11313_c0_g2_i1:212-727(-)
MLEMGFTRNYNFKGESSRRRTQTRPRTALTKSSVTQRSDKSKRAIIRVDRANAFPLRLTKKNFHLNELFTTKFRSIRSYNTNGLSKLVIRGMNVKRQTAEMPSLINAYWRKTPGSGTGRRLMERMAAKRNSRNGNMMSKTMEVRVKYRSERKHLEIILPKPELKLPKFLIV